MVDNPVMLPLAGQVGDAARSPVEQILHAPYPGQQMHMAAKELPHSKTVALIYGSRLCLPPIHRPMTSCAGGILTLLGRMLTFAAYFDEHELRC